MHRLIQLIIALCVLSAFVVAPIAAAEVDLAAANGPVPFGNAALDDSADLTVPEDTDDTEEEDTEESVDPVDPTTTAKPEKRRLCAPVVAVAAVPEAVEFFTVIGTAVMAGGVFLAISDNLGISWDGATESWNDFVSSVQDGVNDLFHQTKWVYVTSGEGKAALQSAYQVYSSAGGPPGKKDGKWYFKAHRKGKNIEIDTDPINEADAVKALRDHNDIMTLDKDLAKNLLGREKGLTKEQIDELKFEWHHEGEEGYFEHLHDYIDDIRLHIWVWT